MHDRLVLLGIGYHNLACNDYTGRIQDLENGAGGGAWKLYYPAEVRRGKY